MSKLVNCAVCGQRCEKKTVGLIAILFGFPMHMKSFCCDECKREWNGGGRIWFGKKWRQQFIIMLIVVAIIFIWVKMS